MPGMGRSGITTVGLFAGTKYVKLAISTIKVVILMGISPCPSLVEEHMLREGNSVRKSLGSNDDIWLYNVCSTPWPELEFEPFIRHRTCRDPPKVTLCRSPHAVILEEAKALPNPVCHFDAYNNEPSDRSKFGKIVMQAKST